MNTMDHPLFLSLCLFLGLWLSMLAGVAVHRRRKLHPDEQQGFNIILTATLTLLSLILGFSFSMANTRYDQRKGYEEAEANAIGTEYARAEVLPAADAARVQGLLRQYLQQRILFYETGDRLSLPQINGETLRIQKELWAAVKDEAATQTTAAAILVMSGMNDVINSQERAQGSWWNRIPTSAWILMTIIAVCANLLLGFGGQHVRARPMIFLVLPFVISTAFYLIAEIDSPRNGVIHVVPENLVSLSQSLQTR
ncbi:MAG: hypothetical protein WBG35_05315 [Acidobacteriaceae bacterium]